MARGFQVPTSFIRKVLTKAVDKRYNVTLDDFLAATRKGEAQTTFPGSNDLVELTKYL